MRVVPRSIRGWHIGWGVDQVWILIALHRVQLEY